MAARGEDKGPEVSPGVERLLRLGGDPLSRAREIVRQTALRHEADISTLFVVREGRQLELAAGFVRFQDGELSLPTGSSYELDWDAETPEGLTAAVAITGQPLSIESLDAVRRHPAHRGHWDREVYPCGVDDPETGFGCLYAVPLRLSPAGEPRRSVIGVFKIERRRSRQPFNDADRTAFDLVAAHLSTILASHEQIRQVIDSVDEDLVELYSILSRLKDLPRGKGTRDVAARTRAEADRAMDCMDQLRERLHDLASAATGATRGVDSFFPILAVRVEAMHGTGAAAPAEAPAVRPDDQRLLERVEIGLATVPVAERHRRTALRHIAQWLTVDAFEAYRPQIRWLIEAERWPLLLDSFYRVLPFGTGGRRGPVGIGTNRFNPYMLGSSVQGHIDYLRATRPGETLSVVVAYDVRLFRDLRDLYNPELPNPLLGLSSRDFARLAAEIYAANGVHVYMLPEDSKTFLSTPELSFAVRSLGASAGLNISASHNHPDDNGGKFYTRHGGQEVPPYDEAMAKRVESVAFLARLDFDHAKATGLISWLPGELHEEYIGMNLRQSIHPEARDVSVVFAPLHGTGATSVGEVLGRAGFEVHLVPEQATPDGRFPGVPFRIPNPEVPESMERGMQVARERGADLVISCDPDADRIGVCARTPDGDYRFLTGNEICVLVAHYKLDHLRRQGRLPARPLVIKTEVTTELLRSITEDFGGTLIGDLLVGFKYHADILEHIVQQGRFRDVEARLEDFVVAVEESHGILVTPEVRDKDAAGGAILLAELTALERRRGRTLIDYLDDIYRRYGYYAELLSSMVMTGAEGLAAIQSIQNGLRDRPPESIGGFGVTDLVDHWDETGAHGAFLSRTDHVSRNVLAFRLENGARIILRPSGTEPKNKAYIEVPSEPLGDVDREALQRQRTQTDCTARLLADDFTRQMLATIGVRLPDYALRISGLVPLDRRIDFAERFLPALEARAVALLAGETTEREAGEWIDESLSSYGQDSRGLVGDALREYLRGERVQDPSRERARQLAAVERLFFDAA